MSLIQKTKSCSIDTDKLTSWELDSKVLDDWLEDDLKQSNLYQCCHSNHTKVKIENDSSNSSLLTATSTAADSNDKCSLKHILTQEQPPLLQTINPAALKPNEKADNKISLLKLYSLIQIARQTQSSKNISSLPYTTNNNPPPSPVLSTSSQNTKHRLRTPRDIVFTRQRNTDAARRSRLRKVIKMETLEERFKVLKTDQQQLRLKTAVLETEVNHVKEREERNRLRVTELEAQLAAAHQRLLEEYQKN
ncbi:MAG: hypothetical protein EXX96DRAFT_577922 [Benjaminiella poitrasii]|nr:MAG: hypothetical protein EXX96DRAFT_577922 [Benjaminiella poitrasii]